MRCGRRHWYSRRHVVVDDVTTRRDLILGAGAALMLAGRSAAAPAEAPVLGEDGLYHEPWFVDSFLEFAEDVDDAARRGKRFALMWEQRGCPYCRETHLVNLARPDIATFVRTNFDIVQLDIHGAREVADFDGVKLYEKQFAAKYGVHFTPTIQFFPSGAAGLKDKASARREVARLTGYLRPDDFLAMFHYVREEAYATRTFREFLRQSGG
jgi:thioredoxin-related protein